jgi:hypothetical protein
MPNSRHALSRPDREQLDERGLVKLEGLVPRRAAEALADRLWTELARKDGARRDDPRTWTVERPWAFQSVRGSGAFADMATPELRAVLDDLIGGPWNEPRAWGQPLVCFPQPGAWSLPSKVWHLDLPGGADAFSTHLGRVFLILGPLQPQGGGTLIAAGSHRLVARMAGAAPGRQSSAEARRRLKAEHAWFRDLMGEDPGTPDRVARFMEAETVVAGVPCRVEEMTGAPGDVFLMHPLALHTMSPNVANQPRLVLTETIYPKR